MSKLNSQNPFASFVPGFSESEMENAVTIDRQIVCWRTKKVSTQKMFVKAKDANPNIEGTPISPRKNKLELDFDGIEEARKHAQKIRNDLKNG